MDARDKPGHDRDVFFYAAGGISEFVRGEMSDETIFTHPIRVYYEDTDFSGAVYHAAYLKFFERGRTEAMRSCDVHHSEMLKRKEPLAFAVRKMAIEWVMPARIDDLLTVQTRILIARGARMALEQEIWREADLIARADVEVVCITLDGRPRRVPADIKAQFTTGD